MIRSGDYKYVAYCGEARERRFTNLADDPEEWVNLADASIARWSKEMRHKAAKELRSTESGFRRWTLHRLLSRCSGSQLLEA